MAKVKDTKNKNDHEGAFSLRDLRAAISPFQGHPDKVAARVHLAAKDGKFIAAEVITWLQQNAKALLAKASEEMLAWLATFGIKSTPMKGV
jgi:hypothetical protein